MAQISFNKIKELFNDEWDLGVITPGDLLFCSNRPIKCHLHRYGRDCTKVQYKNSFHNTVVLVKYGHTWDYTHYKDIIELLSKSDITDWYPLYTNYKDAAVMAGLGVLARNSLLHSVKFGFDCHIAAVGFVDEIVDIPVRKPDYSMLTWCHLCNDCVKACPSNAIKLDHGGWVDSAACVDFIFFGKSDAIPNVIDFWRREVHPEIPQEVIDQIHTSADLDRLPKKLMGWDSNGYAHDGVVVTKDGKPIQTPHCRECTAQKGCSKWNGKYKYVE